MHDVPYFDRFAAVYDILLPETDAAPLESGLAFADRPVEQIVDLGGGTGRAGRAVEPETVVLDASEPMLTKARDNGYPTVRADARHFPIRSNATDAVLSVDAIHHLPSVGVVLTEAARILRPGGVVVIRDFDPSTVRGRGLAMAEHLVGFDSTFYSSQELASELRAVGLEPTILDTGFVYTVVGKKQSS